MADRSQGIDTQADQSRPLGKLVDWLGDNVGKPLHNGGVQIYNAIARAERIGIDLGAPVETALGANPDSLKMEGKQLDSVDAASTGSAAWFAQGAVNAATSFGGYLLGATAAGRILRLGAKWTRVSEKAAAVLLNPRTEQIVGSALYDGLRDTQPGETRLGNVSAGMTAMSVGSLSGRFLPGRMNSFLSRSLTGAIAAPASLTVSDYMGTGQLPSSERLLSSALTGMTFAHVLPVAQEGVNRGIDTFNLKVGAGAPLDRYIARNRLSIDDIRADNNKLPAATRFKIEDDSRTAAGGVIKAHVLDEFAGAVRGARVQPWATAVEPRAKNRLFIREPEFTAFREAEAPSGLSLEQKANWQSVQRRLIESEILGREVYQKYAAQSGNPAGGGRLSRSLIREAFTDGRVRFTDLQSGEAVKPHSDEVGATSIDLLLGPYFSFREKVPATPVNAVKSELRASVQAFPTEIHANGYVLKRGEFVLGASSVVVHLPAMPRPEWNGRPPLSADFTGTTWLARNGIGVELADKIHPGSSHAITGEYFNLLDDIKLIPGKTVAAQLTLHALAAPAERFGTNTNGQGLPNGRQLNEPGAVRNISDTTGGG